MSTCWTPLAEERRTCSSELKKHSVANAFVYELFLSIVLSTIACALHLILLVNPNVDLDFLCGLPSCFQINFWLEHEDPLYCLSLLEKERLRKQERFWHMYLLHPSISVSSIHFKRKDGYGGFFYPTVAPAIRALHICVVCGMHLSQRSESVAFQKI